VHRGDVVGVILYVLANPDVSGPVNVTAPGVLTMKEFCTILGRVMGRPSWAPVPGFVLRLLLGEMSGMLLTGQKAVPARIRQAGYRFRYPEAESALRNILQK
jgi:NAD dependent epimerase/dehydratase family enzyme